MKKETQIDTQPRSKTEISGEFIFITYTFYIILYEALVIGGCGYVTFFLGHSGWWWVLAVVFSNGASTPSEWNGLLTGKDNPTDNE